MHRSTDGTTSFHEQSTDAIKIDFNKTSRSFCTPYTLQSWLTNQAIITESWLADNFIVCKCCHVVHVGRCRTCIDAAAEDSPDILQSELVIESSSSSFGNRDNRDASLSEGCDARYRSLICRQAAESHIQSALLCVEDAANDSMQESHGVCVICQEIFDNIQKLQRLPCCHGFHPTCLTQWLKLSNTCPVCRFSLSQMQVLLMARMSWRPRPKEIFEPKADGPHEGLETLHLLH